MQKIQKINYALLNAKLVGKALRHLTKKNKCNIKSLNTILTLSFAENLFLLLISDA